jgi:hypothetical protein
VNCQKDVMDKSEGGLFPPNSVVFGQAKIEK